jgi:hypothetical protein
MPWQSLIRHAPHAEEDETCGPHSASARKRVFTSAKNTAPTMRHNPARRAAMPGEATATTGADRRAESFCGIAVPDRADHQRVADRHEDDLFRNFRIEALSPSTPHALTKRPEHQKRQRTHPQRASIALARRERFSDSSSPAVLGISFA